MDRAWLLDLFPVIQRFRLRQGASQVYVRTQVLLLLGDGWIGRSPPLACTVLRSRVGGQQHIGGRTNQTWFPSHACGAQPPSVLSPRRCDPWAPAFFMQRASLDSGVAPQVGQSLWK